MKNNILFSLCGDRNKASSRVRGFWIAEELEKLGVPCTLIVSENRASLVKLVAAIPRHDVVVFQKTYSRYHRWLMALANRLGKKTILDLDDAPSRTQNPVTLRNVEAMMKNAFAVTVGSENLLAYARPFQSNSHLIPSSIPIDNYVVKVHTNGNGPVCLGWIGNGKHYCEDLTTILREPLTRVARETPIRLRIVGACGERNLYETFQNIPGLQAELIDAIEWRNPQAVQREIAQFDVGLYPLLPSQNNHFKCAFKALEYMASGIPVISSRVAFNQTVIDNGDNGILADSTAEWTTAITELAANCNMRSQFGKRGRGKVCTSYSTTITSSALREIVSEI